MTHLKTALILLNQQNMLNMETVIIPPGSENTAAMDFSWRAIDIEKNRSLWWKFLCPRQSLHLPKKTTDISLICQWFFQCFFARCFVFRSNIHSSSFPKLYKVGNILPSVDYTQDLLVVPLMLYWLCQPGFGWVGDKNDPLMIMCCTSHFWFLKSIEHDFIKAPKYSDWETIVDSAQSGERWHDDQEIPLYMFSWKVKVMGSIPTGAILAKLSTLYN